MDESVVSTPVQSEIESGSRWASEEWRSFELYEKKRVRTRRSRLIYISMAVLLFLVLCSVPVVDERAPKWHTLKIARDLSVEVEKLKTLAIKSKRPAQMSFLDSNLLQIDLLEHCAGTKVSPHEITHTPFLKEPVVTKRWGNDDQYKILTPAEAKEFSIVLVGENVCFDPVDGLVSQYTKQVIAIVPVKDLAEKRLDRASYVIIDGESAKVNIN